MSNATELVCEGGSLRVDLDRGVAIGRGGHWTPVANSSEPDWLLRGVVREWKAMRFAIVSGASPEVGAAEGHHLIACLEAAREAAAQHCEVAVSGAGK